MSRNAVVVDAPPHDVFAVLLDPWAYDDWVVGAKRIRAVDDSWPAPGSRFHHSVGAGPTHIDDSTKILEVEPDEHLTLEVRFRPIGVGVVKATLAPLDHGVRTCLVLEEVASGGPARALQSRALDAVTHLRNALSLWRLRRLVLQRARRAA